MSLGRKLGKAAAWMSAGAVTAASPAVGVAGGIAYGGARIASRAVKNPSHVGSKMLFGTTAAIAGVAGVGAELANPDGPWGEVAEDFTGVRNPIGLAARTSFSASFSGNNFQYNQGPLDYYEGGHVNPQALNAARRSSRVSAPDGSMVMGMYNRRRG